MLGRYLLGVLLGGVALGPVHTASYRWRARLIEGWTGAPARLAEFIADIAVVICVSELLGSVHLYRLSPMVATLAAVGVAGCWAEGSGVRNGSGKDGSSPQLAPSAYSRAALLAPLVAVSVVLAEWSTRTVAAYHHGMLSADTIWYHLPFAARFVQDGSITAIHYVDAGAVTAFFPASSELLHSLGILLMGNDVLSPLINTLWLALAFLAAWCIGRPFRVAPITLTGAAILFATPGLVATQPGGAYDDVVGLALLLSSVALLVNTDCLTGSAARTVRGTAALAAGLALGTKFTFIAPVAALTVGIWFLAPRGKRLRHCGLWLALVLLTGGFWYGRNFLAVGNPLPSLHLKLGPIGLPTVPVNPPTSTVAQFLFNVFDWRKYYLPGLRLSFGPAWWALLALALVGLVLGAVSRGRQQRVLGLVGLTTGIFFLFTPQFLSILGVPVYFVDNVRYVDPALVLGLVLLPINPIVAKWRRARWLLGAYCVVLAVTQLDSSIWPTSVFTQRFVEPVRGSDSVAGLLVGVGVLCVGAAMLLIRSGRPRWQMPRVGSIIICGIVLLGGFPLQQVYLRDRYIGSSPFFAWAQHVNRARIGVIGPYAFLQYPLYGAKLSNYVQYLGVRSPDGAYTSFDSCTSWRQALNIGHYSYVLITTSIVKTKASVAAHPLSEMRWTGEGDPTANVIMRGVIPLGAAGYVGFALFHISGHLNPTGCTDLERSQASALSTGATVS